MYEFSCKYFLLSVKKDKLMEPETNLSAENSICGVGLCALHIWNMKSEELNKVTCLLWQKLHHKSVCMYVCLLMSCIFLVWALCQNVQFYLQNTSQESVENSALNLFL